MVFGLTEVQKAIIAYLYALKDTPQSPPDPRLSVKHIAKRLGFTQKDVKKATRGLLKRGYVRSVVVERQRYYFIDLRGIREWEKHQEKRIGWEISTKKVGLEGERREIE